MKASIGLLDICVGCDGLDGVAAIYAVARFHRAACLCASFSGLCLFSGFAVFATWFLYIFCIRWFQRYMRGLYACIYMRGFDGLPSCC